MTGGVAFRIVRGLCLTSNSTKYIIASNPGYRADHGSERQRLTIGPVPFVN